MTTRAKPSARGNRYSLRRKLYFGRNLIKSGKPGAKASGQDDATGNRLQLEQELGQMREILLRQRAEFDNFRKRTQREKDHVRDSAAENVLHKLLPVVDNMERALSSAESASDVNSVREGVRMILIQLNRALEAEGLVKLDPRNQLFDPTLHEAIATEERSDVPENHVCDVLLPGYSYKEKLVRAAMVKVAKSPNEEKINATE